MAARTVPYIAALEGAGWSLPAPHADLRTPRPAACEAVRVVAALSDRQPPRLALPPWLIGPVLRLPSRPADQGMEMTGKPRDVIALFTQSQPLFTALGDERRQTIVILLLKAQEARGVGEIAVEMQLSQPAVSHHLKILRDARLLTVEREARSGCTHSTPPNARRFWRR